MITMKNIIREGNPTLREMTQTVTFPLSEADQILGQEMLEFLENSQNPEKAEELGLRAGVGLAAPQLNISKKIMAVLIPSNDPEKPEPILKEVMYNPKIVSHSVQEACLSDGEGCLSVDRNVEGYVIRPARITITYTNAQGEEKKARFKNYTAIVLQHEIDHLNGIMFYDHINPENPFALTEDVLLIK